MRSLKTIGALVACGLFAASVARADTIVSQLDAATPADIVNIAYPSINGGNPEAVYSGMLQWHTIVTNSGLLSLNESFSTYCIDILHDIGFGGQYRYDVDNSLISAAAMSGNYQYGGPTQTIAKTQAIENLWADDYVASLAN